MNPERARTAKAGALTFALVLGLGGAHYLVPRATALSWTVSSGPLEPATIALFCLAAVCYGRFESRRLVAAIGVLLLLFLAFVKLDPGGWIVARNADSLHFYISPETSNLDKLTAASVVLVMTLLAVAFISFHWSRFKAGLRRGGTVSTLVALALGFLVLSQTLDKVQGSMEWPRTGYRVHAQVFFGIGVTEEVLEFFIPVLFLAALGFASWDRRRRHTSMPPDRQDY